MRTATYNPDTCPRLAAHEDYLDWQDQRQTRLENRADELMDDPDWLRAVSNDFDLHEMWVAFIRARKTRDGEAALKVIDVMDRILWATALDHAEDDL